MVDRSVGEPHISPEMIPIFFTQTIRDYFIYDNKTEVSSFFRLLVNAYSYT